MVLADVHKELKRSDLSFRDDFYSEIFNKTLSNLTDLSDNIEYYSSLDKLKLGTGIKMICARLLKYLENNSFSRNKDNEYIYCLLLNYWVYNKLNVILQSNHSSNIYRAFGEIELIWNDFINDKLKHRKHNTCEPIHSIIMYEDWKDRMDLYEYYVDYSPVSKTVKIYQDRCKDFHKYVEGKKKLYKHFKKSCPSDDTKVCPEFYKQCLQYDPDKVLPELSCHQEIINKREADAHSALKKENTLSVNESDSEEADDGMMPFNTPNLNENSYNVRMYGNVLLGVVATSMISGALYRFTHLGNTIRNGLGWNNNNMRNFNGRDNGLFDYVSESFNPYPGEEHYIGYHPA